MPSGVSKLYFPRRPASPETLGLRLFARIQLGTAGNLLGQSDEEAAALFAEGMALAAHLDDPSLQAVLLMNFGLARSFAGANEEGLTRIAEAVTLADGSNNTVLRSLVRSRLVTPLNWAGRLREAIHLSEEAEGLGGGQR